jgi:ADP-L-glycero-D-manno-heptose 6-epimerase
MTALYRSVGRTLSIEWMETPPELRDRYQYFTEARMQRLRAAGYDRPFASVEEGVRDYVERYLATGDPYR